MAIETDLAELEKAVRAAVRPTRVTAFTRWVGSGPRGGRALTQAGRVRLADAKVLVTELGTGDAIDPVIGDRVFRTKSK